MKEEAVRPVGETAMLTLSADEWAALCSLAFTERRADGTGWIRNPDREADANRIGTVRWWTGNESHYLIDGWTDAELRRQAEDQAMAARRSEREAKRKAREYPPWPDDPENHYLRAARAEAEGRMIRVRLWRSDLTGCAHVADAEIEAPKPLTRRSLYTFLHEVGHIALGHIGKVPRHAEEYEAERWAHMRMRELGFAVPRKETVRAKQYIARKIRRAYARGAKRIDPEARRFTAQWRGRR